MNSKETTTTKPAYEELVTRNIGILTRKAQSKIRATKALIAGCGVGSVIAELAARTGFGSLLLVDGDCVEPSNLNRQIYSAENIGQNKAFVTAEKVKKINPVISAKAYPKFLTPETVSGFVSKADIVIDTIDISALPVILSLHKAARIQGKNVLFPLNLGWGSGLFVFNEKSKTFEEMLGINSISSDKLKGVSLEAYILPKWTESLSHYLPQDYLRPLFKSFLKEVKSRGWCPVPQLGIAAFLTASLTVTAMVNSALGLPLKYAPEMNRLDALTTLM